MYNHNFCRTCGGEVIKTTLDYMPWYMELIGGTKYSKSTGQKNTVTRHRCINWKPWYYFQHHDEVIVVTRD